MPLLVSKAIYYAYSNATLSASADAVLDAWPGPRLLASAAWPRRDQLLSAAAAECPAAAPDSAARWGARGGGSDGRKMQDIEKLQVGRMPCGCLSLLRTSGA